MGADRRGNAFALGRLQCRGRIAIERRRPVDRGDQPRGARHGEHHAVRVSGPASGQLQRYPGQVLFRVEDRDQSLLDRSPLLPTHRLRLLCRGGHDRREQCAHSQRSRPDGDHHGRLHSSVVQVRFWSVQRPTNRHEPQLRHRDLRHERRSDHHYSALEPVLAELRQHRYGVQASRLRPRCLRQHPLSQEAIR